MSSSSGIVAWSKDYALGLDEIDAQHEVLFDLLNAIWEAIVRRAENAETIKLVEELERYTVSHFTAEEAFMRVTKYPHFVEHKRNHDAFVERVNREKMAVVTGGKGLSVDLVHYLKDWLVEHILMSDKAYADFYARSQHKGSGLGSYFTRLFR